MAAGIRHARGRVIVTMDGDLQNDPDDIGLLLREIDGGCDIVVGWRFDRQDGLITRKIPSRIANWIIARITGIPIRDNGCTLKAYKASVIKRVPLYAELHRFIPAMTSIVGARIGEVKVRHHPRRHGTSKYGLTRVFRVALDLLTVKTITSFASQPLIWFAFMALPSALLGTALALAGLRRAVSPAEGSALVFTGTGLLLLALSGFLVLVGVLCELVCRHGRIDPARMALLTVDASAEAFGGSRMDGGGCRPP